MYLCDMSHCTYTRGHVIQRVSHFDIRVEHEMTVTEFATLKVVSEDGISAELLAHLARLSELQSSYSGYPLYFYSSNTPTTTIYLLSKWSSVEAHNVWIASDHNQQLLKLLIGKFLEINDFVHIDADMDLERLAAKGERMQLQENGDRSVLVRWHAVEEEGEKGEGVPKGSTWHLGEDGMAYRRVANETSHSDTGEWVGGWAVETAEDTLVLFHFGAHGAQIAAQEACKHATMHWLPVQ